MYAVSIVFADPYLDTIQIMCFSIPIAKGNNRFRSIPFTAMGGTDVNAQFRHRLVDILHSTLKNTRARGGQLAVDTIEQICNGLGISLAEFFTEGGGKHGS